MTRRLIQLGWAIPLGALMMSLFILVASHSLGPLEVGEDPEYGWRVYELSRLQRVGVSIAGALGLTAGVAAGWWVGRWQWLRMARAGLTVAVSPRVSVARRIFIGLFALLGIAGISLPALAVTVILSGGIPPEWTVDRIPYSLALVNFVTWMVAGGVAGSAIGWVIFAHALRAAQSIQRFYGAHPHDATPGQGLGV